MWTCVKWEAFKQTRQVRFWGSLAALMVLGGLFSYGYSQMRGQVAAVSYVGRGLANGFFVPVLALTVSSSILLPFFVTLVGGDSLAGERQQGTWATLLTQGVNPWDLVLAKWWIAIGYVVLSTGVLTGSSLVGGWILFGLHGSALPSGVTASYGTFWHLVLAMAAYAALGQMVVASFALLVSAFARHTLSAVMVTMGSLIVLAMLGDLPFLVGLRRIFFTTYFSRVDVLLGYPPNWHAIQQGMLVYGLYGVVFAATMLWFQPFRD